MSKATWWDPISIFQVQTKAFTAGVPAHFNGKIVYPQCRTGVFTPTDWNPELARRSAQRPRASLQLEFVYGYGGLDNTSPNLFYTSNGSIVYYTAAVGIVYDMHANRQKFFLEHTDDIKSLAICPEAVRVEDKGVYSKKSTAQYEARRLIATGQLTPTGGQPMVFVWDVEHPESGHVRRLDFAADARGIVALAFSPDGTKLVSVSTDNQHTVQVWDWRKGQVLVDGKGGQGVPPFVWGVVWDPFGEDEMFVTYGVKHVKYWRKNERGSFFPDQVSFGKMPMQNVTGAVFVPPTGSVDEKGNVVNRIEGVLITGHPSGELYMWSGGKVLKSIKAHGRGPKMTLPDGSVTYSGVRGLVLKHDRQTLLTGAMFS